MMQHVIAWVLVGGSLAVLLRVVMRAFGSGAGGCCGRGCATGASTDARRGTPAPLTVRGRPARR